MTDPKFPTQIPNVVDPKFWPNPKTIKPEELQKYIGLDMMRMQDSFRAYRKSALYISGTLLGFFFTKVFTDKLVKFHIFGENGNGGEVLRMQTQNTIHDYTYNRQFQRMRWLAEEPTGDDPSLRVRDQQLVDLGVKVQNYGANLNVRKLVPHDKYLI